MSKVFIGVGHGGSDPGAVANGLKESAINLGIALAMQAELLRHGVSVGLSRLKEENDPLVDEIKECNAFAPDVAVEIHTNAGGGDGFEVYRQTNKFALDSMAVAKAIEKNVITMGQNSRGVKTKLNGSSDWFGWNREVKAPAVLCECGFIDSNDRLIFDTVDDQKLFGRAYARGVLEFLGIDFIEDTSAKFVVVRQVGAFSSKLSAQAYAGALNKSATKNEFYYVLEK